MGFNSGFKGLMRMDRLLTADRGLPAAADLFMLIMFMLHAAIRGHLPVACMICRSGLEGVGFKYYSFSHAAVRTATPTTSHELGNFQRLRK